MEGILASAQSPPQWMTLTRTALEAILVDFVHRRLPHRRIAKLAGLLLLSSDANRGYPAWAGSVADSLLHEQQHDGGWVDCEDTAWCSFASGSLGYSERLGAALRWLEGERSGDAWGYCRRDRPCIPITSTIRLLVPALRDQRSASWLREAWSRDLESSIRLSYKAAWYLLAEQFGEDQPPLAVQLRETTKELLLTDQRPDGGWGPWRDHPAPTDCFCTGIAMWAIALQELSEKTVTCLKKALQWCESQCLPNGLFPTHFVEEGSAWVYVGSCLASRSLGSERLFED